MPLAENHPVISEAPPRGRLPAGKSAGIVALVFFLLSAPCLANPFSTAEFFPAGVPVEEQTDLPEVDSIVPDYGYNDRGVGIRSLNGSNFIGEISVELRGLGFDPIESTNLSVDSEWLIMCNFDLRGAAPGLRDVVVANQYGEGVLPEGFDVRDAAARSEGDQESELEGGGGCAMGSEAGPAACVPLIAVAIALLLWKVSRTGFHFPFAFFLFTVLSLAAVKPCPADPGMDLWNFEPAFDSSGLLTTMGSSTLGNLGFSGALVADYARSPLRYAEGSDDEGDVLEYVVTGRASAAIGLSRFLNLGFTIPATLNQAEGEAPPGDWEALASGVNDPQALIKINVFGGDGVPGGLAIAGGVGIPAGDPGGMTGTGSWTGGATAALDANLSGVELVWNLGYRYRANDGSLRNLDLDDEVLFGFGAGYEAAGLLEVFGEIYGRTVAKNLFSKSRESPVEAAAGIRFFLTRSLRAVLGASAGLTDGVGSPSFRGLMGIEFVRQGKIKPRDADMDGIPDEEDGCPGEPEDLDGFNDADGCPDPDNDGDGIPDAQDGAVDEPEDFDGFEDEDGVPDPDNDSDGIPDIQDACPDDPEDRNGIKDEDGCPDEGIPDNLRVVGNRIIPETPFGFLPQTDRMMEGSLAIIASITRLLTIEPEGKILWIEVHTDNAMDPGDALLLTEKQAGRLATLFVLYGLPPHRIRTAHYGSSRPVASNRTAKGREANRRVEFYIIEGNGGEQD